MNTPPQSIVNPGCPPCVPSLAGPTYSQAVLTYVAVAAPTVAPLALALKMQACPLDTQDTSFFAELLSDVTIETATGATRTLTFALGQTFNDCLQPTPAPAEGSSIPVGGYPGPGYPPAGSTNPPLGSASTFFQDLYTFTLRQFCACRPDQLFQLPPIVT